jgi:hypothetical protein
VRMYAFQNSRSSLVSASRVPGVCVIPPTPPPPTPDAEECECEDDGGEYGWYVSGCGGTSCMLLRFSPSCCPCPDEAEDEGGGGTPGVSPVLEKNGTPSDASPASTFGSSRLISPNALENSGGRCDWCRSPGWCRRSCRSSEAEAWCRPLGR